MGLVLGRKPGHETCVFPCKVAAGGDERRLEAVAGTLVLMFLVLLGVLHFGCLPVCVVLCGCGIPRLRSHWNGCMNVAWGLYWGGSRSTKPSVFPCAVAAGGDEGYLVCAAGAGWPGVVCSVSAGSMCFANFCT